MLNYFFCAALWLSSVIWFQKITEAQTEVHVDQEVVEGQVQVVVEGKNENSKLLFLLLKILFSLF